MASNNYFSVAQGAAQYRYGIGILYHFAIIDSDGARVKCGVLEKSVSLKCGKVGAGQNRYDELPHRTASDHICLNWRRLHRPRYKS